MANSSYTFTGHNTTAFTIPTVTGENETYGNDGDSVAGFSLTNCTASTNGTRVLLDHTTETSVSNCIITVTTPNTDKDWILYFRVKKTAGTEQVMQMVIREGATNPFYVLYLNYNTDTTTRVAGAVSLWHRDSVGADTFNLLATGFDTASDFVDLALLQDATFNSVGLYYKESYTLGTETQERWKLLARVATSEMVNPTSIDIRMLGGVSVAAGDQLEFEHLYLCAPNMIAIGDSICKGMNLHSNAPADGLDDDTNTWMHWAPIQATSLVNSLIVNKGIGGNKSAQIEARTTADVVNNTPQLVFLHGSTNDYSTVTPVALADRTTDIQDTVNLITGGGANVVFLNSVYCGSRYTAAAVPGLRDYYKEWWQDYRGQITGVDAFIDIMFPIIDYDGYMIASLINTDHVHPLPTGMAEIGRFILNGGS